MQIPALETFVSKLVPRGWLLSLRSAGASKCLGSPSGVALTDLVSSFTRSGVTLAKVISPGSAGFQEKQSP